MRRTLSLVGALTLREDQSAVGNTMLLSASVCWAYSYLGERNTKLWRPITDIMHTSMY
jgi:hypothetical protein